MKGMFVALEGIDASGKATQSKILAERLKAKLFSFPAYHTKAGQLIAGHLQSDWSASYHTELKGVMDMRLDAFVLQSLMLTNRMELAVDIQNTLVDDGNIVCDRYWCSGYAYGRADGLDGKYLLKVHELLPKPRLQLLIDIDPADSIKRRPERRDRYEKQAGLMEVVVKNYRELWADESQVDPKGWVVIDGRKSVEEVTAAIWKAVEAVAP